MAESIVIIGAGMGGLSAGVYGRVNGYRTQIFEMHSRPGGQCTSWKRKGYTFDPCIHHFWGCRPGSNLNRLWQELGAMPRETVALEECVTVVSADGRTFPDYYDLERLRRALLELAPADAPSIEDYIRHIQKLVTKTRVTEDWVASSFWANLTKMPSAIPVRKWMTLSMGDYAAAFSDPFLRRAFSLIIYSQPEAVLFFHLLRHAGGLTGDLQWPVGGSAELAKSIERRYLALGGEVRYGARVDEILVEDDRATGVRLADGTEHRADIVISNADGRRTILDLLGGRYINDVVRGYCQPVADETPFAVTVFLGVNRDLSAEPSSLIMLLDEPVTMAGHDYHSLEAQLYGFDKTMAPPGKGTIKVEWPASYGYWKRLHEEDREGYRRAKDDVAAQTLQILEHHLPGIGGQVEVIDVCTLMTWERYTGGSQGWFNLPNREFAFRLTEDTSDKNHTMTLPGLSDFYFVGLWATMMPSLLNNANSGKTVIKRICKKDRKKFRVRQA
jgi:phytoene dehydrogenase-like protein